MEEQLKTGAAAPAANGAAKGTVKYRVEVTCYDGSRFYREGDEVEFANGAKPFREDYFTKL